MAKTQMLICPYCGEAQPLEERCRVCRGFFEPLSRQATHNSMGPWFIRDTRRPHRPGCSYETLVRLIERRQLDRFSIIRGPTTRQFWAVVKRVPGVSHLLGYCHNCDAHVEPTAHGCPKCGVPFGAFLNRNYLGLPDIRPLPWEADLDLEDRRRTTGNGDGQGATPTGTGTYGGAPPKRNVGISSFATDEELTGAAPVGQPVVGPPAGGTGGAASQRAATSDEPVFVDVPGEEPGLREEAKAEEQAAGPTPTAAAAHSAPDERMARTLRATVLRQRRTIRMLTIAVIAIAVLSAAFSAYVLRTVSGNAEPSDVSGADARPVQPEPDVTPAPPTGAADEGDVPPPDVADEDEPVPATGEPDDEPAQAEPGLSESAQAALAGIDEAMQLLEASSDESRSLDDRIADCEAAVELLEAAEQDVPAEVLPDDFAATLTRSRTELERLRLTKFFP